MSLFTKSDPISAAAAACDKLRNRLAESETAIGTAKQVSQRLALDGASDKELDEAEAQVRTRIDRVTTLRAALTQSDEQIAALQATRDAAEDKRQRLETIAGIETKVKSLDGMEREFNTVMTKMAALAEYFGLFVPEAAGLQSFTAASKTQIPDAIGMIKMLAANHCAAVLAGTAPAALRTAAAPFVPTVAPKPTTVLLFALRPVKWRDGNGEWVVAQKFTDVALTPAAAVRALASKAAVQISDPLRMQHHNTVEGHGRADTALDLDAPSEQSPQPDPITHTAFQRVKVGEPYVLKVAREG